MPRVIQLPPPPLDPVRSPSVVVPGESRVTWGNGLKLEGHLRIPKDAARAVVLCHPHPLYGGSMHSPVPLSLARVLSEREDVAYLRFNFRGVGGSEGTYDGGDGELEDAMMAIALVRERLPGAPISIGGHSFGSWVGLRAALSSPDVDRVALIGPSTRFFDFPERESQGRTLALYLGDQDEFCDPDEGELLARRLGAEFHLMAGMDHHFLKSRRAMAETVAPMLAPDRTAQGTHE